MTSGGNHRQSTGGSSGGGCSIHIAALAGSEQVKQASLPSYPGLLLHALQFIRLHLQGGHANCSRGGVWKGVDCRLR
jgi:hypothetical protein